MKTKDFFKKLQKLYSPDFNKKGVWKVKYAVKFWCQAESFSYCIYDQKNAFSGKPIFESEVFHFWNNKKTRKDIMKDITKRLKDMKS